MRVISLYFHTLRHLRPSQILWRVRYRLSSASARERPPVESRPLRGTWSAPPPKPPSWRGDLRFCFLNHEHALSDPTDWNPRGLPKLWLYNLHYFDWLQAADAAADPRRHHALMRIWVANNPAGHGNGWEPYPLSLRIANWVKFALATSGRLPQDLEESLAIQLDVLSRRIEYHLRGNHLMANAKALIFGGWFFRGEAAESWERCGLELLRDQLAEQVLPDGGHFERSPMYHAIILEDVLDLINLAGAFGEPVPQAWRDAARRMRGWLGMLCHRDGDIAFFNDAAFGIASDAAALEDYANRLGLPPAAACGPGLVHLPDSGFLRWEVGPMLLLADLGSVGPDDQPGHAHAGTLSFELSVGRNRLLVNTGTSTYAPGAERTWERSTAAHNTLSLDGENSSEVWASFRVARRARVRELAIAADAGAVQCAHDGFRRLPGRPVHRRSWYLTADGLTLTDDVLGGGSHRVGLAFHFHPAAQIVLDAGEAIGTVGGAGFRIALPDNLAWTLEEGAWSPRFGERICNWRLRGEADMSLPCRVTTRLDVDR